jgi:propionyl-CoA carboxylase alpha chain
VRNDTGVFEGGEISRFYDPMIAKLCSWGPDRAAAIETMRGALDAFEVEGIGHNLPFLAAVMDHPRFVSGDITTAFIAQEWPEGFHGVTPAADDLARLAALAAAMHRAAELRAADVSGAMANRRRIVRPDWVVALAGAQLGVTLGADGGATVDGKALALAFHWRPGATLVRAEVDGRALVVKVERRAEGFRLRWRGADLDVKVRAPEAARLAALMPVKVAPDTSKVLLCPMPGLVVAISVAEGQEVQEGQALCTVEAMKMENVLRAERKGIVKRIAARAGASLAVDDVILEFA